MTQLISEISHPEIAQEIRARMARLTKMQLADLVFLTIFALYVESELEPGDKATWDPKRQPERCDLLFLQYNFHKAGIIRSAELE